MSEEERGGSRQAVSGQPAPAEGSSTEADRESDAFSPPTITFPKGGGAIRGLGEKFAANPATGTGSLSVPVFVTPGRSGFSPQLALSYDSGNGNGPFGFGWSLSAPSVTRKTDKELPRYRDADGTDVFILSGTEDLVPVLFKDGAGWKRRTEEAPGHRIDYYRPRTEGLFARIERWTDKTTGEVHWRSVTRDNVTTLYGRDADSRVADPADGRRVFSWLICESYDDKGNAILYEYAREDAAGVDLASPQEKNRLAGGAGFTNRYLKRVKYGNRKPRRQGEDLKARQDWCFEVVFDYGEHDAESPEPAPPASRKWPVRRDPFSSYRAGFEVRTYRLCRRVLMFHHFGDELGFADCLVRSTDLGHRETPVASFVESIEQCGYRREPGGAYLKKTLPRLEFAYTEARIDGRVRTMDSASAENLPAGLDGSRYQWVDLDSEGLPGVLSEQAGAWFYKRNLSPDTSEEVAGEAPRAVARLAPVELVSSKPSLADLTGGRQQLMDLGADGLNYLVQFGRPLSGYYRRDPGGEWEPFNPFRLVPNVSWEDPNLKFLDLTGDGRADILISEDERFVWYQSRGAEGFGPAEWVRKVRDGEKGPALVFADAKQSIYLADMSGDGLTDIVRVGDGEVCYWPNLGYGRFGAKVTMGDSPYFDHPDRFDQRRIRLADVDGSGAADIIYLAGREVRVWFNQSGNSWSEPHVIRNFPQTDNVSYVAALDLLGNGTACLVWSSPLPRAAREPLRYIDLMGGQKPHLLASVKNNLGAETRVEYAPSTKFYIRDRLAGRPWATKLPFPVQVVERVRTLDRVSNNRFITRYAYHHGFYDGAEREFRGFAMVERWDTEEFAALNAGGAAPQAANVEESSHVPPVLTRTWFHTGVYFGGERIGRHLAGEFYAPPGLSDAGREALLLPDTLLPHGLGPDEAREAARALKGSILRQEVYARDGSAKAPHPYAVSERNYAIEVLQPRAVNLHAVHFVHERETLEYQYERRSADPRVMHALTLEVDEFGNVLKSFAASYGRKVADASLTAEEQSLQTRALITYTENLFTNPVSEGGDYRAPLPCETRVFHLTGAQPAGERFTLDEARGAASGASPIAYEAAPDGTPQKRLVEHTRSLFRSNTLAGPLPLASLESLALPYESYKLALTPSLVAQVLEGRAADAALSADAGYVHVAADANWWAPSGRLFFSEGEADSPDAELAEAQRHFFLPRRFRDPFGTKTLVRYDAHDLLPAETIDAVGNVVRARYDYRVMQPELVTDPNGNRTAAAFDARGLLVGTAVMGKEGEGRGDLLTGFEPDLDDDVLDAHFLNPLADARILLRRATTRLVYDLFRYHDTRGLPQPMPNFVHTLSRDTHDADLAEDQPSEIRHGIIYSDGFGRELQQKVEAEPGPLAEGGPEVSPRWVGSGWTVFNNKGLPVKKFEPFFSDTHRFEFRPEGVSSTLFYDPVGRAVATLHPDYTYEKITFDAWRQTKWDVNDNVLRSDPRDDEDVGDFFRRLPAGDILPTWHARRITGALGAAEQAAAVKAAAHADTPSVIHLDTLGRPFLTVADGGAAGLLKTLVLLDIEGNQRAVIDPLGRVVESNDYDMLGARLKRTSMDAGARLVLNDVTGKLAYRWDGRGRRLRQTYDAARRPLALFLRNGAGAGEALVRRNVYGERHPAAASLNLRGRVFMRLDGAGVIISVGQNPLTGRDEAYDFKGNLLRVGRRLAREYKQTVDWSAVEPALNVAPPATFNLPGIEAALAPLVEAETFRSATTYDALNRPVSVTTPDGSVALPTYNQARLLESLGVRLRGSAAATSFVSGIAYDVKGRRQSITYGNGVVSSYDYDPRTFRLTRLQTLDGAQRLQSLSYSYDPVGNVTSVRDGAQQDIYFANQVVTPDNDYTYDPLYRLTGAGGREHIGQLARPWTTHDDTPRANHPHPSDGQAMRRYTEQYEYDGAGNLARLVHQAVNGEWTRRYVYDEPSLTEPARRNNRLTRTAVGRDAGPSTAEPCAHDPHGNVTEMPHLSSLVWDFEDRLHAVDLRGGGRAFYVYDAAGERVRKVWEKSAALVEERVYLGGFEVFRRRLAGTPDFERETLHVMDDKRRVALVETRTVDGGSPVAAPAPRTRYQHTNHIGSAVLELSEAAERISYEEYYPYGGTSFQAVRAGLDLDPRRYRYTGKERDEETGLYYHGARYYAPWLARWTSCDPQGLADGLNLYAYVSGNPVRLVDPTGTQGVYDEEAGVCRVEYPTCTAENPAGVMSAPEVRTAPRRQPPPPRPQPPPSSTPPTTSLPPVSGPDYTLHVQQGFVYTQYQAALGEMSDSNNSWGVRIGMGVLATLASPLAIAEEYIGRPMANVPFALHNAGIGAGEHAARGYLLWQAGEPGEATVEGLHVVRDVSFGLVAGLSVGMPVAGAIERTAATGAVRAVGGTGVRTAESTVVGTAEGGSGAAAAPRTVPLHRAVREAELANIEATGAFQNPAGIEVKYFSTSAEDAAQFARMANRAWPHEGPYTLVSTELPEHLINSEMRVVVDRGVQTVVVPTELLPRLSPPVVSPAMPIPRR